MRTRRCSGAAALSLALLLVAGTAAAQGLPRAPLGPTSHWVTHGPPGSSIFAIAFDPSDDSRIYAGTTLGVFISTDGGVSWQGSDSGFARDTQVTDFAFDPLDPSTVYATQFLGQAGANALYRSSDSGAHWTGISPGLAPHQGDAVAIDPGNPSTIYLATSNGVCCPQPAFFKSTDGGATWQDSGPTGAYDIHDVVVDPLAPDTVLLAATGGLARIYLSTDGAATWSTADEGIPVTLIGQLAMDPTDPLTAYAAGSEANPGLFKSIDLGHWAKLDVGIADDFLTVAIDPKHPSTVFAGTRTHGVWRSSDGGATWAQTSTGLPTGEAVQALAIDPAHPSRLVAGTTLDAYRSRDAGTRWHRSADGLAGSCTPSLAVDPADAGHVLAGTVRKVFASHDGGLTWDRSSPGMDSPGSVSAIAFDPGDPSRVYAGTQELGGIWGSRDGGGTWKRLTPNPFFDVTDLAVAPGTPEALYATLAYSGIYKSTDGGATFEHIFGRLDARSISVSPARPDQVFATIIATDNLWKLIRSTDGGATWTVVRRFPAYSSPGDVLVDPFNPDTVYLTSLGDFVHTFNHMFRSDDAGATWIKAGGGLGKYTLTTFAPDTVRPGAIYGAVTGGGVWQTLDRGTHWSRLGGGPSNGLTLSYITALAVAADGSKIYAGACSNIPFDLTGAVYEMDLGP